MAYELPPLPYAFDALEPHIDAKTMEIHHDKHHAAYVTNVNKALEAHADLAKLSIEDLCKGAAGVPDAIKGPVRNNGGGHFNHSFFWKLLSGKGGGDPKGASAKAIESDLGGFAKLKEAVSAAGATRFGSGWAWVSIGDDGKLFVSSTPNQDNPLMKGIAEKTGVPILGIDVWEHAYYLKYQNRRPDYLAAIWNVINWDQVEANYQAGKK